MFKIITKKRYNELVKFEDIMSSLNNPVVKNGVVTERQENILHCGAKSCQFHTTNQKDLATHRESSHK